MRTIRGFALGTYYAAGADAAKQTPKSTPMRGLVCAVKDNREPPSIIRSFRPIEPSPSIAPMRSST